MHKTGPCFDGTFMPQEGGHHCRAIDPATEQVLAKVAAGMKLVLLVSESRYIEVCAAIDAGHRSGARLNTGGERPVGLEPRCAGMIR